MLIRRGHSFDEDFVRNFYGYLSSQTLAGRLPNPFQMFRFLDDADVIVVVPLPLASAVGTLLNVVLGEFPRRIWRSVSMSSLFLTAG